MSVIEGPGYSLLFSISRGGHQNRYVANALALYAICVAFVATNLKSSNA